MSAAIRAAGVEKTYREGSVAFRALKGVDFAVDTGEFVLLSGPSGSGKTTLLSILGCVLSATAGTISILGHDVSGAPESVLPELRRKLIGFVFQGHNLIASLDASENVELALALRGWEPKRARDEARAVLGRVGLGDKVASLPRDLSGGQRQRVAIARALAGDPPLVLADEPTASLDAKSGLLVTELLKELARERGTTVVVVTHDNRIFHLGDRMVHIEDGNIVEGAAS